MPLALICDCGARFEIDELHAGKETPCPECAQPVRSVAQAVAPRTSLWALASIVLALVGAFTLIGTAAAFISGLVALAVIRQQPERLKGAALALAGIVLSLVFSLATLAVLAQPNLLPLADWFRQRTMAGQVDTSGALLVTSRGGEVFIERPSRQWGRARNDRTEGPVVGELQQKRDLLLVNISRHAYVDVFRDTANSSRTLVEYVGVLIETLNPPRPSMFRDEDSPRRRGQVSSDQGPFIPHVLSGADAPRNLEPKEGYDVREWQIEQARGGQRWWFLIRAYKRTISRPCDPIFVVRAYTPKSRRAENEEELRKILDSVSFSP